MPHSKASSTLLPKTHQITSTSAARAVSDIVHAIMLLQKSSFREILLLRIDKPRSLFFYYQTSCNTKLKNVSVIAILTTAISGIRQEPLGILILKDHTAYTLMVQDNNNKLIKLPIIGVSFLMSYYQSCVSSTWCLKTSYAARVIDVHTLSHDAGECFSLF